jgi:NAD(P)H dehydrogenase (quinone)
MIQQLIRQGELAEKTSDLTDVLGQQLPSLSESIQEI